MKKYFYLVLLICLALIPNLSHAAGFISTALFPSCNNLFSSSNTFINTYLSKGSTYSEMISITMLVILTVLTVLGIIYMVGMAFGIEKLKAFVKSEYMESFANLLIVVLIVGGISGTDTIMTFLSSITSVGLQSYNVAPVTSTNAMYVSICNGYYGTIDGSLQNIIGLSLFILPLQLMQSFQIDLTANGGGIAYLPAYINPGLNFRPLEGTDVIQKMIILESSSFSLVITLSFAVIILLLLIYFLFPLFLYLGLLLRSFPWTRAAGGSMIALFISFYIIFPAVLYPFISLSSTLQSSTNILCAGTSPSSALTTLCNSNNLLSSFTTDSKIGANALYTLIKTLIPLDFGGALSANADQFVNNITFIGLQLLGIIIAFIISFDLMEQLGDILGSPSLKSKTLFNKLI